MSALLLFRSLDSGWLSSVRRVLSGLGDRRVLGMGSSWGGRGVEVGAGEDVFGLEVVCFE